MEYREHDPNLGAGEVVTDGEGVSISFDASLPDIEQYALVAFFDGNPARQWSEKTKEVPHGRTCSHLLPHPPTAPFLQLFRSD